MAVAETAETSMDHPPDNFILWSIVGCFSAAFLVMDGTLSFANLGFWAFTIICFFKTILFVCIYMAMAKTTIDFLRSIILDFTLCLDCYSCVSLLFDSIEPFWVWIQTGSPPVSVYITPILSLSLFLSYSQFVTNFYYKRSYKNLLLDPLKSVLNRFMQSHQVKGGEVV